MVFQQTIDPVCVVQHEGVRLEITSFNVFRRVVLSDAMSGWSTWLYREAARRWNRGLANLSLGGISQATSGAS